MRNFKILIASVFAFLVMGCDQEDANVNRI